MPITPKKKLRRNFKSERCLCVSTSKLGGSSIWWRWVDSVEQIAPGHCSGDGVADTLGILRFKLLSRFRQMIIHDPWSAWSSVSRQILICRQIRLRPNGKLKLWACWGFNNILGSGSTIWEEQNIFLLLLHLFWSWGQAAGDPYVGFEACVVSFSSWHVAVLACCYLRMGATYQLLLSGSSIPFVPTQCFIACPPDLSSSSDDTMRMSK